MPIHAFLVHFPVAFLVGATLSYCFWAFSGKTQVGLVGLVAHGAGVVGCVLAIFSGNMAEGGVAADPFLKEMIERHETLAQISVWVFGMLGVWAFLRKESPLAWEKWLFVVLFLGATLLVGFTAHLGGELVYQEGVGVTCGRGVPSL